MSKVVYVELLTDVAEGGQDLTKAGKNATLKVIYKRVMGKDGQMERHPVPFRKGLVITMTEEGADKWVKRGIAKVVTKKAA